MVSRYKHLFNNIYIFIFSLVVFDTLLGYYSSLKFNYFYNFVFIICIIFSLLKILFDNHSNIEYLMISFVIFVSLISSYESHDITLITNVCLIIAASDVNSFKINKYYFYIGMFITIIIFLSYLLKIVPNYIFFKSYVMRNSFGFNYPNSLSEDILTLCISYCLLRFNKISWIRIFIFIYLTYFVIKYPVTRMDYYCMIILLIIVFIKKFNPKLLNEIPFNMFWLSLPLLSIITLYLSITYNGSISFYVKANKISENRLFFSNLAIKKYGFPIFGHVVNEIGQGTGAHYFFIDQSIIRIMVTYGVIILLLFIIYFTYKMFRLHSIGLNYLVLLASILIIRGFFDKDLIDIISNPFLIILASNVEGFLSKKII